MRKVKLLFTIGFFVLIVLCLSACSNSLSFKDSGNISFEFSKDLYNHLSERSGSATLKETFDVQVKLYVNDALYSTDLKQLNEATDSSITFDYKNISVKSKVYAAVTITLDGLEYASGKSPTITIKKGTNELAIPLKLIKFSVPRTKYMIGREVEKFDRYVYYDYYLCDTPDAVIPENAVPDFKNVRDYCFDKDGYVYAISRVNVMYIDQDSGEESEDFEDWLKSNKPGFENRIIRPANNSMTRAGTVFSDMETGAVYYTYWYDAYYYIEKVGTEIGWTGNIYNLIQEDFIDRFELYHLKAYDNYLYILYRIYDGDTYHYYLTKRNLTVSGHDLIVSGNYSSMEIDFSGCVFNENEDEYYDFKEDFNYTIPDMIYQDGFIYMFFRYESLRNSSLYRLDYYSYGGIIRINFDNNEIKQLGFSTDVQNFNQNAGFQVYVDRVESYVPGLNSSNKNDRMIINYSTILNQKQRILNKDYSEIYQRDLTETDKNNYISYIPLHFFEKKIYAPSSASSSKLFGPSHVVALRPKQLVFADDGCFFYADGDVWRYKNAGRVVIVDLETFSIKNVIPTNNESFLDDKDYELILGGINSHYEDTLKELGDNYTIHYYDEGSYYSQTMGSGLFIGIPKGR